MCIHYFIEEKAPRKFKFSMNYVVIILCKLWEVGEEVLYSGHLGTTKNPISPLSNLLYNPVTEK